MNFDRNDIPRVHSRYMLGSMILLRLGEWDFPSPLSSSSTDARMWVPNRMVENAPSMTSQAV